MRARWLKPEFFTDKKIAELGPIAALVYQALWVIADDGGTAKGDAETLKSQVFYRWECGTSAVTVRHISTALQALCLAGRIVRYRVGDDEYSKIVRWNQHQNVHKPGKFRHPGPEKGVTIGAADARQAAVAAELTRNSAENVHGVSPESAAHGTHSGHSAAPLPASPPPRLLDSYNSQSVSPRAREANDASSRDAPTDVADVAATFDELAARLGAPEARNALRRTVDSSSSPSACISALNAILSGNDPATPRPAPEQLAVALIDFSFNGERWNAAHFRGYLRRAIAGAAPDEAPRADATQNGRMPGSPRDRPRAADRRFAGDRNDAVLDAWARQEGQGEAEVTLELPDLDPEPAAEPEEVHHGE
jgi:hypothetical protein